MYIKWYNAYVIRAAWLDVNANICQIDAIQVRIKVDIVVIRHDWYIKDQSGPHIILTSFSTFYADKSLQRLKSWKHLQQ